MNLSKEGGLLEVLEQSGALEPLNNEERKGIERTVAHYEFCKELVDNSRDIIAVMAPSGEITFTSPALQNLLGYQGIDRPLMSYVVPEDQEKLQDAIKRIYQEPDNEQSPVAFGVIAADGQERRLESLATLLTGNQILVNARDITEQEEAQEQLVHAQKMESIGRMAGEVAHDFNNILLVIQGNLSMALDDEGLPKHLRKDLEETLLAANRGEGMTRPLLAFSRKQPVRKTTQDISSIVESMHPMISQLVGENIRLSIHTEPQLYVEADPSQLGQIIMNLATNARDAVESGGTVNISTYKTFENQALYAELAVEDNGIGISKELRKHLFEPYFTTKGEGKGTGLGLSIVHSIVEQHGGKMHYITAESKGTTFYVRLPLSVKGPQQPSQTLNLTPIREQATILLLEDDEAVRRTVKLMLKKKRI